MKLIQLMGVSASQTGSISQTDLLLHSVFGNNIPTAFIPGASYEVGDRVYTKDLEGNTRVYECIKAGIYTVITPDGWKEYDAEDDGSNVLSANALEFVPGGYYYKNDIVFITGENGTIAIHQCKADGRYETVTDGGWVNLGGDIEQGDTLNKELITRVLLNIYGAGKTPIEFIPGSEYKVGDRVYVVDENGIIHVKECVVDGVHLTTNTDGWVPVNTLGLAGIGRIKRATTQDIIDMFNRNLIPGITFSGDTGFDGSIEIEGSFNGSNCECEPGLALEDFATDEEILAMFNENSGGVDDGSGNIINRWEDANNDGSPDTLWNEF